MKKLYSSAFLLMASTLLLSAVFMVPVDSFAEEAPQGHIKSEEVTDTPTVTLERWQNANEDERYSFLVGFMTMLDIEHSWQGDHPRPYKESLIGCWYQGLKGMTYKEVYTAIQDYIAAHPGDLELPLPQVIWFELVQPKVADKINREK